MPGSSPGMTEGVARQSYLVILFQASSPAIL
jgi:hypothetical protein